MYLARKILGNKMVFCKKKIKIIEPFGDKYFQQKVVSSPNVIGEEMRTFGDKNFHHQKYILL